MAVLNFQRERRGRFHGLGYRSLRELATTLPVAAAV